MYPCDGVFAPLDYSSGFSTCSMPQEADMKGPWNSVSSPLAFHEAQPVINSSRKPENTRQEKLKYFLPWFPPTASGVGSFWVALSLHTAPSG